MHVNLTNTPCVYVSHTDSKSTKHNMHATGAYIHYNIQAAGTPCIFELPCLAGQPFDTGVNISTSVQVSVKKMLQDLDAFITPVGCAPVNVIIIMDKFG